MAIKFGMPSLGHTMEKGKVIEWLKREGEAVAKGEPLLVVETDKVVTEVEAPADGVVLKILVGPEEERAIGTTLALLGAPNEVLSESDLRQLLGDDMVGVAAAVASAAPETAAPRPTTPVREAGERVKISPIARKLAEEFGIDPTTLQGTGPGGRISKEDVLRVAEAAKAAPVAALATPAPAPTVTHPATPAVPAAGRLSVSRTISLSGIRGRIAERMWQSWNTIPRVTEVMQVDMSATVAFRDAMLGQWEQQYGLRVSLNDMIGKAVVLALQRHPRLNATLVKQEICLHNSINLGVAVNLDEGLIVPVIFHAEQKDLGQIARESRDLAEKARAGRLQLDDLSDGTFTITNLGTTGIDLFTPIINPPQVAILGIGMVQRRPVVVGDALAMRPSVYLCLVFDHRAVDGVPAANFLQEVQRLLSKPQEYAL